jgi:hypothetical protein
MDEEALYTRNPSSSPSTHLYCSYGIVLVVPPVLPEPAKANWQACPGPCWLWFRAISPLVASSSLEKRPYFRDGHHNMKLFALSSSLTHRFHTFH